MVKVNGFKKTLIFIWQKGKLQNLESEAVEQKTALSAALIKELLYWLRHTSSFVGLKS